MEKRIIDEALYALGNAPKEGEKIIYLHQSHKVDPAILPSLFQFAIEAYASGYTLMIPMFSSTLETVLEAAFILDRPLYVMLSRGLGNFKLNSMGHRIMVIRGGFLAPAYDSELDRIGYMVRARILAVERSCATLLLDNDYQDIARETLDRGHDLAVLRCCLDDKEILKLAREGAPVLDSFSSWMEYPKAISFEMEDGPFREPSSGRRFSVLFL